MNDNNKIVMLIKARSWVYNNKGEATKLAQWISDNKIDAIAVSLDKWNEMKKDFDKDK